jgi:uncharacterized protein (DUF1499 family)
MEKIMRKPKVFLVGFVLFCGLFCFCSASRPKNLGVVDGKLIPCPTSPNCVSTQAADDVHAMPALPYNGSKELAMDKLVGVIKSMKRTKVISRTDSYLYVEFTTSLMRYVDDVEFYFDDATKSISFRSASRIGYSDMGVNKKRMREVGTRFISAP